ncbi:hypothetical protein [Tautonia plasticadhaerens]|uniref:Uncharacterized protein n=1 Tax=Tautonia plasticadhaerens TaxID=2527974 RepID=A0A518H291_9BACT|nr:hypothetical protein [Tautonia plasticadhaerens]QDV34961.1 hypothetical protein ElP_28580 [Tautonia plasticadhaerens]
MTIEQGNMKEMIEKVQSLPHVLVSLCAYVPLDKVNEIICQHAADTSELLEALDAILAFDHIHDRTCYEASWQSEEMEAAFGKARAIRDKLKGTAA